MISLVELTASEAACLCVPYLGEAKCLDVTANQSEKRVCMCFCTHSQLGMNQRVEKEARGRMTGWLDTQTAPCVTEINQETQQTQKNEVNAAAKRKLIRTEKEEFNWPNSHHSKDGTKLSRFHLLHLHYSMGYNSANWDTVTVTLFTLFLQRKGMNILYASFTS